MKDGTYGSYTISEIQSRDVPKFSERRSSGAIQRFRDSKDSESQICNATNVRGSGGLEFENEKSRFSGVARN